MQPYLFKRNQSGDNRSHGFGAKFLLKKLSANDFSYERKSALRSCGTNQDCKVCDLTLDILQFETQTRLINCLSFATDNFTENVPKILRIHGEFSKNLPKKVS